MVSHRYLVPRNVVTLAPNPASATRDGELRVQAQH